MSSFHISASWMLFNELFVRFFFSQYSTKPQAVPLMSCLLSWCLWSLTTTNDVKTWRRFNASEDLVPGEQPPQARRRSWWWQVKNFQPLRRERRIYDTWVFTSPVMVLSKQHPGEKDPLTLHCPLRCYGIFTPALSRSSSLSITSWFRNSSQQDFRGCCDHLSVSSTPGSLTYTQSAGSSAGSRPRR